MKKFLVILAAVIVVLIAVALAVPFLVPADTYKAQLIARVKDATGRDLGIGGKVSFSILPSLALEANDVSFSNAPGASSKDMAKLGKLQVQLKLWPLLHREVEIDRLVLVDPVIALEVDKAGRPNWQLSQAAPARAAAQAPEAPTAPKAAKEGTAALAELRLNDVRLVNGRISYLDRRTGEKQELGNIAMNLSLPSLDRPFKADGSAVWRSETISLTLSLDNPRAFMDGKVSGAGFKVAAKPIGFDFKGEIAGSTPAKLDGTVDLKVPSLRGLANWLGSPLTLPGTGYGPLDISGKVSMAGSKIGFSNANLALDALRAKGELALDAGGAKPALKGRLDVDRLDLNPYLPPETQGASSASNAAPATPAGSAKPSDWSDQPIDVTGLKSADVDFALSTGGLQYRKIQVGKSALSLHLKDGRLIADLTELALYQGGGKGKVVVDGSGAVPAIEADFNLDKVQIGPLLHDAMDLDRLSGTGAFNMAVTGHGRSQREIINALNGKGDLNLGHGAIKGMNLVAMVKNVATAFEAAAHGGQETEFASLSGSYTITNGVLHNNDLQLKSADVPMTGAGTVDLPHRNVDYKVTPKIAGSIAVPVLIKGPWDNLSYRPDLAGLVGDPSKLQKGVGDAIKSAPKVDSLIKGILGGKK